jgi:hypothetical protein
MSEIQTVYLCSPEVVTALEEARDRTNDYMEAVSHATEKHAGTKEFVRSTRTNQFLGFSPNQFKDGKKPGWLCKPRDGYMKPRARAKKTEALMADINAIGQPPPTSRMVLQSFGMPSHVFSDMYLCSPGIETIGDQTFVRWSCAASHIEEKARGAQESWPFTRVLLSEYYALKETQDAERIGG